MHFFMGRLRLFCLNVSFHTTGVFITTNTAADWLKCVWVRISLHCWTATLPSFGGSPGTEHYWKVCVCVLLHSYSCTYFLTGSSVTLTVVHVSHGPDSVPPQRVTLGPAWDWTRESWVDLKVTSRISNLWTCIHRTLNLLALFPCCFAHLRIKFLWQQLEWQTMKLFCKKLFYMHLLTLTTWMSHITLRKLKPW